MDRRDSDNQYQALPAKPSPWVSWVGRMGLKLLGGWQVQGQLPDIPKAIIAIAPHTSNWDFFVGLMVKFKLGLEVNFLGKHSLFRFPIKGFLTRIGGIPVQRDSAHGVVGSMSQATEDIHSALLQIQHFTSKARGKILENE
ncbi:1-acyl-sn-glycerol-3-phosphate acyltransferase [Aliidiomarina maris]|uniref:Acyltransferase-like protein n=2 Tax=Aliidiomarina maris TaxID=531312 RepID=A0A327WTD5_9GAMM|nr:1-acyl-sn-glycerol-3-phosphate acyltransferase [Aliidiomarina maris]MCL5049532.1 1-acyl-sn-glycerol-3-phosphate acyltransferase [Bacillota bacterium]RAJ95377.1 acyltransferase-like protein [Aliidiomarina maris]